MSIYCEIKKFPPAKTGLCAMFDNVFEPIVWDAENLINSIYFCRTILNKRHDLPEWCDERIEYESKLRKLKSALSELVWQMWAIEDDFAPTKNKSKKFERKMIVFKKQMKAAEEAQHRETTVGDAHEQEKPV